ncbi:hypothetical protein Pst134EB_023609 [Puccinia striiformis f. sp. tritici]|nr:hypothetical protein Pst134EB_023609 [Puccinia striiformis f. sp. tritici]
MAPNSKKRQKATSSPRSPTSNCGTPARSEDHSQTRPPTTSAQVNSDNDQQSIDVDSASQGGTQTSRQELSDEQELHKARKLHRNERSSTYSYFDPPQLSEKTDKKRRKMIAYRCKRCDGLINRPTYDNSTANLTKHVAICKKKIKEEEESQKLAVVGVSGTGDIDPREVSQEVSFITTWGETYLYYSTGGPALCNLVRRSCSAFFGSWGKRPLRYTTPDRLEESTFKKGSLPWYIDSIYRSTSIADRITQES